MLLIHPNSRTHLLFSATFSASRTDNGVDETLATMEANTLSDLQIRIHHRAKGSQRHGAVAFLLRLASSLIDA
jgi:hypothetical protein